MNKGKTKQSESESIRGFFAVMGDDEILLLKKQKIVNYGVSVGIYRDKEKLISTIPSTVFGAPIEVIEILAPKDAIVNSKDDWFGIKPGKKVRIMKTQPLEEILKIHMSATA